MLKRMICMVLAIVLFTVPVLSESADGAFITDFGIRMMNSPAISEKENALISPASAYFALLLALIGAEGETEWEIISAIGADDEIPLEEAKTLLNALIGKEDTMVAINSSVWIDDDYEILNQYREAVTEYLNAEQFTFELSDPEAVNAINRWVNDKTKGLIPTLLDAPLSPLEVLMLINTVYFNGFWQKPFFVNATYQDVFYPEAGGETTVDYMSQSAYCPYFETEDGAKGVSLKYIGGEYAFIALLPPEGIFVRDYIKTLTAEGVADSYLNAEYVFADVKLPKFEADSDFSMAEVMKAFGMELAFDSTNADFSDIAPGGGLYITDIVQKTKIRVMEEGTEAAAVTGIGMATSAMRLVEEPIKVHFDRPFVYFVMNTATDTALFMGIFETPENSDNEFKPIHHISPNDPIYSGDIHG